jgi:TolB-like protein
MNTKLMVTIAILSLVAPFSYAGGKKDQSSAPATPENSPSPSAPTSPYFIGDGGKGMRLAVLEPTGNGLSTQEQWVLSQVQGSITADFNRFSAITIIDRQNLEKILAEQTQSLSGNYSEQDYVRLGNLTNARFILTGTIRKTANNYMLELAVTDAESGERRASYPPKAVSLIALENNSAAREATADMLKQLGVNLTDATLQELKTVENNTAKIQAENALARGIVAQRQGTEVEALSYFFQAAAFDPSLTEAIKRSSILAANISSGNIGEDVRNDIQWRRNWIARIAETEQYFNNYFDNFFKTGSSPYTLFYTTEIKQGPTNYDNETTILSIETNLHASSEWLGSVESMLRSMQSSIKAVQDGLTATKRASAWGLDKWPWQSGFNLKPFGKQNKNFTVIFELVNSKNQVIGRQTLQTAGSYEILAPMPEGRYTTISVSADDRKTVTFTNVKADDITDSLTIRIASVNGVNAETAARNGVLQVSPLSADEWNSFHNPVYSITNNYPQPPRQQTPSSPPQSSPEIPQANRPSKPSHSSLLNQAYFPFKLWGGLNYSLYVGPGFTFGIVNLYTSWNFNGLFFDGRVNAFEWTVGWSIPVVSKYLMIPIGLGGNTITSERNHKFVLETGLQLCLGFVYLTGIYRLTGWNRHGFTIGAGFGDLEW